MCVLTCFVAYILCPYQGRRNQIEFKGFVFKLSFYADFGRFSSRFKRETRERL